MTDSFDQLRQKVFAELDAQQANLSPAARRARYFGAFVEACLVNMGKSRAAFAKHLDIEPELADAILDGLLPASEIDDAFLTEIAHAVNYEPDLLRVVLGQEITPTVEDDSAKPSRSLR